MSGKNYLAIDTTGKYLKLLLVYGGGSFYYAGSGENTHSMTLFPCIESLFQKAGCGIADMDCIGVVTGPGSFTGIRIGIAAVKGMCRPRNIPAVPVNTFMLRAAYNKYAGGLGKAPDFCGDHGLLPQSDEAGAFKACFDGEIAAAGMIPAGDLYPVYLQNSYAEGGFAFDISPVSEAEHESVLNIEKAYLTAPYTLAFDGGHIAVAARDRGRIAGFYCAASAPDHIELLSIAVLRGYRRCGVGGALIEDLTARAKELGKKQIFLEVAADNAAAAGLYEKHGFKKLNVRKSYYPDGRDARVMVKDI